MFSFKPTFSLSSFTFIKRLFSSSSLSAIRVVSPACLRLLIFLPAILIPPCVSSSPAFKLKNVGETARPFRYDLNQIPYYYAVEVRDRFNGLDLIDRLPDELWNEVRDIVQETGIKTIPMEKKCKKAK